MTTITDKENKDYDPTFTRAHYDYTYHARVYGMESLIAHIAKLRKKKGSQDWRNIGFGVAEAWGALAKKPVDNNKNPVNNKQKTR